MLNYLSITKRIATFFLTAFFFSNSFSQDACYFLKFKDQTKPEQISNWIKAMNEKASTENVLMKKYFKQTQGPLSRVYGVYGSEESCLRLTKIIQNDAIIEYLERNPNYKLFHTPNDLQTAQYNLKIIQAENAWDLAKGIASITVAVVDDAVETGHSDLKNAIWKNPGEIAGNGIDDDRNGYVDDVNGWDAADNDNNPNPPAVPGFDHGTHCAGIVGAETNNGSGIASIGYGVKLIPVKIAASSSGLLTGAAQGVEYAIIANANVISMSWGGTGFSRTYQLLFDLAASKNIICVAAAGNSNTSTLHYPAAYNNVISVASTTSTDTRSSFSNYGTWIDVCAPGSDIYSTVTNGSYDYKSGTSMACPLVSGLCALMLSKNPSMAATDIESCLKSSCDNINSKNPGFSGLLGNGRINAEQAIKCVKPFIARFTSNKRNACPGDTVVFKNNSIGKPTFFMWRFSGGNPSVSFDSVVKVVYSAQGSFDVKFYVTDGTYKDSTEEKRYISVRRPTGRFLQKSINVTTGNGVALPIKLTGDPNFRITVSDGTTQYNFNSSDTFYYAIFFPSKTTTYRLQRVTDNNCLSNITDTIRVNVLSALPCNRPRHYFDISHRISGASIIPHGISWWNDNLFISGTITGTGAGGNDAFLCRTDDTGRILWFRVFGGSNNEDVLIKNRVSPSGRVYVTYRTRSYSNAGGQSALTVFDVNGNIVRQGETRFNGNSLTEVYNSGFLTKDQKFVTTGLAAQYSGGLFGIMMNEFDSLGNIRYHRVFTTSYQTYSNGAAEAKGGYILGGDVRDPNERTFLLKTNRSGTLQWSKRSTASFLEKIIHVKVLANGDIYGYGIAIPPTGSGFGSVDLILHCFDSSGNIRWSKVFGGTGNDYCGGIEDAGDGLIMVSQTNSYDGGRKHKLVFKTDYSGKILWSHVVGSFGRDYDYSGPGSPDLAWHPSRGLVLYAEDITSGRGLQLLNMGDCGDSKCGLVQLTINSANITVNFSNLSVNSGTSGGISTISQTISNPSVSRLVTCRSTINPPPNRIIKCRLNADFRFTAGSCTADSVLFTDISIDSAKQRIVMRYWDFGDGATENTTIANIKHRYSKPGSYRVKLTVVSADSTVCTDTAISNVRMTDSFTVSALNGKRICLGDSLQLGIAKLSCGKAPFTFQWTPATGLNNALTTAPKAAPSNNTIYTLTVKDADGRTATDTVRVDINAFCCKKPAGIIPQSGPYCVGQTIRVQAKPDSAAGHSYSWHLNGSRVPGATAAYLNFKATNAGLWKVKCVSITNCGRDSSTIDLYVNNNPSLHLTGDTVICKSSTLGFKAIHFGNEIINWSGSRPLNQVNGDSVSGVFDQIGWVAARATDRLTGCKSNDTAFIRLDKTLNILADSLVEFCPGKSAVITVLHQPMRWLDGFTPGNRTVTTAGKYIAETVSGICTVRDTVTAVLKPMPARPWLKDTFFCRGDSLTVTIKTSDQVRWQDNSTLKTRTLLNPGTYLIRITNAAGCEILDSLKVKENAAPKPYLGPDTTICDGQTLTLQVRNTNPLWTYRWDDNSNKQTRTISGAGTYRVTAFFETCPGADTIIVRKMSLPKANLGPDINICGNNNITLNPIISNARSFFWENGSAILSRNITAPGIYYLTTVNECGTGRDSILVFKNCPYCPVWVPNIFTPGNADQLNDNFKPVINCPVQNYEFTIFNRWGQIIFRSDDPGASWDGTYSHKPVSIGMYVWKIDLIFPTLDNKVRTYSGPIIVTGK